VKVIIVNAAGMNFLPNSQARLLDSASNLGIVYAFSASAIARIRTVIRPGFRCMRSNDRRVNWSHCRAMTNSEGTPLPLPIVFCLVITPGLEQDYTRNKYVSKLQFFKPPRISSQIPNAALRIIAHLGMNDTLYSVLVLSLCQNRIWTK